MKQLGRIRRHKRVTKKVQGSSERPRLVVFRSKRHMYAQLIDDSNQRVIATVSTLGKKFISEAVPAGEKQEKAVKTNNKEAARRVGVLLARKALQLGLKAVNFDRAGYKYHGRIKSLADGAREGGLQF